MTNKNHKIQINKEQEAIFTQTAQIHKDMTNNNMLFNYVFVPAAV